MNDEKIRLTGEEYLQVVKNHYDRANRDKIPIWMLESALFEFDKKVLIEEGE